MPPRRKTKNVNGHRRRKKRNAPQYSTVAAMEEAKAKKCKEAYDALPVKPHEWKAIVPPDPALAILRELEDYLNKHRC